MDFWCKCFGGLAGVASGRDGSATPSRGLVTAIRACGLADGSLAKRMKKISYKGYRFPPEIIQQAIRLYRGDYVGFLISPPCLFPQFSR